MVGVRRFSLFMVKYAGHTPRTQKVINSHQNSDSNKNEFILSKIGHW